MIRERSHALVLSNLGERIPHIAKILLRNEHTVREWITSFNNKRISSIFTKYIDNVNASKITKKQREEIKEVLNKPPSEYGIPKEFWDIKSLKKYLKAEFGIVYESKQSYHFLFKLSDLSFKLPSTFDVRRDDEKVEKRVKEIRQEIQPYVQSKKWEVFVSDETRMVWESEIRRAWIKKGKKTVIKVNRQREHQNYIGYLNLKDKKSHLHRLEWQKQETIIESLKKIKQKYPNKKICLIWDNAQWHKGKLIKKELGKGNILEKFHLINFPPYAPDKNPQEHIWERGKHHIANADPELSFDKLREKFEKFVRNTKFNFEI